MKKTKQQLLNECFEVLRVFLNDLFDECENGEQEQENYYFDSDIIRQEVTDPNQIDYYYFDIVRLMCSKANFVETLSQVDKGSRKYIVTNKIPEDYTFEDLVKDSKK